MPFLHVQVSVALDSQAKEAIRDEIAGIMSILPNKTRDNTMIRIEGGASLFMGEEDMPCAFADLRLFRASPDEAKAQFIRAVTDILNTRLKIPPGRTYVNIIELQEWGAGGARLG